MFQVQLAIPHGARTMVGPQVATLGEARIVVKMLDWLYATQALPAAFAFYNDETEIEAIDLSNNDTYDYKDQDPSGHSDGIWDGPSTSTANVMEQSFGYTITLEIGVPVAIGKAEQKELAEKAAAAIESSQCLILCVRVEETL